MSAIGADLPPHLLAKRKRQQDEETRNTSIATPGAERLPSPDGPEKRRKVIGPAMPPAPLDERPSTTVNDTSDQSSDEDDDFGPALPDADSKDQNEGAQAADWSVTRDDMHAEEKLRRDDWMMMPPKQDDLAARLDPTRQRPTKFNTAKGAKGPAAGTDDSSTWYETPEQKRKRLEDEMMGVVKPAAVPKESSEAAAKRAKDEAARRNINEHNESRGPSLVEQHRQSKGVEVEDDPSKRAFDREKDMSSGSRISASQKREMLNKAAGLSGKFAGGSYL